jgi:hypothetical protein
MELKSRLADLSHSLAGFVAGLVLYILYLNAIHAQPTTYDHGGWIWIGGYKAQYLVTWGLTIPLLLTLGGLFVARWRPAPQLTSSSAFKFLIPLTLLMVLFVIAVSSRIGTRALLMDTSRITT